MKRPRSHNIKLRDSLSNIAKQHYGNPNYWRNIAKVNQIKTPDSILPYSITKQSLQLPDIWVPKDCETSCRETKPMNDVILDRCEIISKFKDFEKTFDLPDIPFKKDKLQGLQLIVGFKEVNFSLKTPEGLKIDQCNTEATFSETFFKNLDAEIKKQAVLLLGKLTAGAVVKSTYALFTKFFTLEIPLTQSVNISLKNTTVKVAFSAKLKIKIRFTRQFYFQLAVETFKNMVVKHGIKILALSIGQTAAIFVGHLAAIFTGIGYFIAISSIIKDSYKLYTQAVDGVRHVAGQVDLEFSARFKGIRIKCDLQN